MNITSTVRAPQTARPESTGHCHAEPKHGKSLILMDAIHVAHDVAMIGMTLPGAHHGGHHGHHGFNPMDSICSSSAPNEPGMFDAFTDSSKAHQGLTLLSAAAAAGATYHGVRMLSHGHYAHGVNHLLMGAGSATMALGMATNSQGMNQASSVLMGAHGAMEAGLGIQSFLKAETTKDKAMALTTTLHGACLAAAQFTGNAAISVPLYLGMGVATTVKIALSHAK